MLDAFHLALIAHVLYFYTVTNFTNEAAIDRVTWSVPVSCLILQVNSSKIIKKSYVMVTVRKPTFLQMYTIIYTRYSQVPIIFIVQM